MSITINYNGNDYTIPTMGESEDWGTRLNAYLVALGAGGSNAPITHVRATRATAQSVNGTPAAIVFNTESYDVLSEYNASTGLFTAIADGYYAISSQVAIQSQALGAGANFQIYIYINNSIYALGSFHRTEASVTTELNSSVATCTSLLAGDTVSIFGSTSGATYNTNTNAQYNYLSIDRLR